MAHKMVTGHAAKKKSKHKVRHMHIERADNGFTADTHLMPEDGKEMSYMEPERKVFSGKTAHQDLANHVMETMGGGMPADTKKPETEEADDED